MGAKVFRDLNDFWRHGMNLHVACNNGNCYHSGIVMAWDAGKWFKAHRWPTSLDSSDCYKHFRCTKCGDTAESIRPSDQPPTTINFFPADQRGWNELVRRLRG